MPWGQNWKFSWECVTGCQLLLYAEFKQVYVCMFCHVRKGKKDKNMKKGGFNKIEPKNPMQYAVNPFHQCHRNRGVTHFPDSMTRWKWNSMHTHESMSYSCVHSGFSKFVLAPHLYSIVAWSIQNQAEQT